MKPHNGGKRCIYKRQRYLFIFYRRARLVIYALTIDYRVGLLYNLCFDVVFGSLGIYLSRRVCVLSLYVCCVCVFVHTYIHACVYVCMLVHMHAACMCVHGYPSCDKIKLNIQFYRTLQKLILHSCPTG